MSFLTLSGDKGLGWLASTCRPCPVALGFVVLVAGDLAAFFLAAWMGGQFLQWGAEAGIHAGGFPLFREALFGLLALLAVVRFWWHGHYRGRQPFWDELGQILSTVVGVAVLDAAIGFLGSWEMPRVWLVATWGAALVLVPVVRSLLKELLLRAGIRGASVVVIGVGNNAADAFRAIRTEPLLAYSRVKAFLDPDADPDQASRSKKVDGVDVPVLPLGEEPEATVGQFGSPGVIIALDQDRVSCVQRLVERLAMHFKDVAVIPALRGLPVFGMEARHFFSHEVVMLQVRNNLARKGSRMLKRGLDVVGGVFFLVLFSPLFAVLAVLIKRDGGPVLFGHQRIGRGGRPFRCYKFRTMAPNAQEVLQDLLDNDPEARAEWDQCFKLKNDPRVTRLGEFLRRTSLDELPQLFNVIKGEMSLVGPRPIVEEELERYGDYVVYYKEAKPGMTGLWQVSGRNDTEYGERVYLDAWYVKNWSLWYDLVILVRTAGVVLQRSGAY